MRKLSINNVQLLDRIDPSDSFISELANIEAGCITWSQRGHLINIPQPRDRNEKLLEFLTRRSVADFQKFTNILSKYQPDLVPLLETDEGEEYHSLSDVSYQLERPTAPKCGDRSP